jgi:long-chain acyl-CoA synthetase
MKYQNIFQLFQTQVAKYGDRTVFYQRLNDTWQETSWTEFGERTLNFACALSAKGLTKGASVAILAGNIPEWTIADIGTIAAGGVGVGIYPTSSREQCEYIINHSDAEFVVVDTEKQLQKIIDISNPLPKLKEIICIEKTGEFLFEAVHLEGKFSVEVKEIPITNFNDFLNLGQQHQREFPSQTESTSNSLKPTDTAIMVYTSGTTGNPKGAMLSHQYILNSVESLRQTIPIFDDDVCFSYLPHCHVAERISGLYNRLYNGTSVYFVDDLSKLYAYMLEVKPTVFASLPRFFEKIHAKVIAENGTENVDSQTVKDAFGGRIRLLTSGGAPLPNEIADFFAKRNLPILQAYGLTENICVAFNTPENLKYGTVGKPMPMCEVKIAADGEILVKSPMMFSGYYKEPEKTAEMFDADGADGWLKTGDLGELDADGFLRITGRKKEIIVLSSGKNVAPALVENYVKENHLISQCFLCGDGKSYCVAIITLNQAEAEMFARANGIEFQTQADLTRNKQIYEIVKTSVEKANARLSSSEQIKKFVILERDFLLELDEITPTLKVKRNVVAKNFADEIESLYK